MENRDLNLWDIDKLCKLFLELMKPAIGDVQFRQANTRYDKDYGLIVSIYVTRPRGIVWKRYNILYRYLLNTIKEISND